MLRSATLTAPRQFGPSTRMPVRRAISPSRFWAASPAAPSSAKPEEKTTAAFVPLAAQASSASAAPSAATAMMARSGASGRAATDGKAGRPCTSAARGFTG